MSHSLKTTIHKELHNISIDSNTNIVPWTTESWGHACRANGLQIYMEFDINSDNPPLIRAKLKLVIEAAT